MTTEEDLLSELREELLFVSKKLAVIEGERVGWDRRLQEQREQLREMSEKVEREKREVSFLRAVCRRLVDDLIRDIEREDLCR